MRRWRSSGVKAVADGHVARKQESSYTTETEVQFNSEIEARLAERAARQCLSPDEFVRDVVARYFQEEDRFVEAVKHGEAALERGDYMTHDQVGDKLQHFLRS